MKISKKLIVFAVVAVMAAISVIPSTFSWYTHNSARNGEENIPKGNTTQLYYNNLPVSIKSAAGTLSCETFVSDANGTKGAAVSSGNITVAANSTQYYKTIFTNTGSNTVMVDFDAANLANSADLYIGTVYPTLNEKSYASRPVRSKVTDDTVRVYFRPNNSMKSYWGNYSSGTVNYSDYSSITNDMNIGYKVSGESNESFGKLIKCGNTAYDSDNPENYRFYFDIPTNTEYFFFCNHWYFKSYEENKEWNKTPDISDLTAGILYSLTGEELGNKNKVCSASAVDNSLVAINQYYSSVQMSLGNSVFADIGLKKTSDDDDFVPQYYGQSIKYQVLSGGSSLISINNDGLITPNSNNLYGTATVRTTVTGSLGDTRYVDTEVKIPQSISQAPIIKNVLVPAQTSEVVNEETVTTPGKVEVDWYALNKGSSSLTMGFPYYSI